MDKVIGECHDDTSPVEMEELWNNEDDDEKEITSENSDEGIIHIAITENERGNISDKLDKVI